MRSADRFAVPVVVTAHHLHGVGGLDNPAERIQENLVQLTGIDVGIGPAVRIPSAFRNTISDIVFQTGRNALFLDAGGHLDAQFGDDEGIFSIAFQGTAPALVAGYVQDRCIDAVVPQQPGFFPGNPPGLADQVPVPGAA